jgi:hypothetical protein
MHPKYGAIYFWLKITWDQAVYNAPYSKQELQAN